MTQSINDAVDDRVDQQVVAQAKNLVWFDNDLACLCTRLHLRKALQEMFLCFAFPPVISVVRPMILTPPIHNFLSIPSANKIDVACRGNARFHMNVKQTSTGADCSIKDKRVNPTNAVTSVINGVNVCLAVSTWKHCETHSQAIALETIPTIYFESVTLCC